MTAAINLRRQAQQTAAKLKDAILGGMDAGDWQPGDRLPTERDLAKEFGASRGTVRQVLAELEAGGRIVRHVGRGTFVAGNGTDAAPPVTAMGRAVNPEEVMEARLILEPALAALAVARASDLELEEIQRLVRKGGAARDMAEFERWDQAFHQTIVAAGKNHYLMGVFATIHDVRRSEGWARLHRRGLTQKRLDVYQKQHADITRALVERDGAAAERAMRLHLLTVRRNLLGY
jgi:GntR family uxuAB operon transcriptional repressor